MSRIITDLPDAIDPVVLIEKKMLTCPLCGSNDIKYCSYDCEYFDANGKHHKFLLYLNKYKWNRYPELTCKECGCKWDTGWYPADHKMFEVEVNCDKNVMINSLDIMTKGLGVNLKDNDNIGTNKNNGLKTLSY